MKKKVDENGFTAKSGKDFLDMIAPSTVKFYTDYFICGNTFRCVWALREYPTSTSEQAILRYLGEKEGVTLHIYARHVTPAEEKRIISNAANKNRMQRNSTNDLQQTVAAESNLQDVTQLVAEMHRSREPLLHTAVYIEMTALSLEALRNMQTEVQTELVRSPICLKVSRDGSTAYSPAAGMCSESSLRGFSPPAARRICIRSAFRERLTNTAVTLVGTSSGAILS